MSLTIILRQKKVYVEYYPENGVSWISENFDKGEDFILKRTFTLTKKDMMPGG